ncbi:MAG TPA: 8-amino-7-oxononanoate synthase [Gemmatimonadaceae bacterium]|nr:8-amino-7-oxononanoate synthase [Gemmatimonadaceae bacterium]
MTALIAELEARLAKRRAEGLERRRRVIVSPQATRLRVEGRELVGFASNDYLGLASDVALIERACEAAVCWGVGAGASHLICGHSEAHEELERELAAYVAPVANARALTFSSGYLANLAILSALAGRDDAVFADRLNHACLNDGALLSRAKLLRYGHVDMSRLESQLRSTSPRRKIIATDAVFSMDGDIAPLGNLLALAETHDALLIVDDAHGFGVLGEGRGTLAHFGIASERIVYMGTLGKAAGVGGAFVAAHPAIIETLVQTARPYIYTTAAPPLLAETTRAALALIRDGHDRRAHLKELIRRFRDGVHAVGLRMLESQTPIQPLVVGQAATAVALSEALWARGLWVPAIRPPTVPVGSARLRISLTASHTFGEVDALIDGLAQCRTLLGPGHMSAPGAAP